MKIHTRTIGHENQTLVIADSFAPDPAAVANAAGNVMFIESGPTYPGVRGPVPEWYLTQTAKSLQYTAYEGFRARLVFPLKLCAYSIVCKPEDTLLPRQCLPHFDGSNPNQLAFVHYLSPDIFGGTLFFRHLETGWEYVDDSRQNTFVTASSRQIQQFTQADLRYPGVHTPAYEVIHKVESRYNRLILYRGTSLHSGDVPSPVDLSDHPHHGRLTVTGFAEIVPIDGEPNK